MKRTLLVVMMTIAVLNFGPTCSSASAQRRALNNDEEAIKKLIHEWAMYTVQADTANLEKIMADIFAITINARVQGKLFGKTVRKKELLSAIGSRQMKVSEWECPDQQMNIKVTGNSAEVSGRCTLSNATFMGQDFSGEWSFRDRFVKKDGSWRAVSSQSRRINE